MSSRLSAAARQSILRSLAAKPRAIQQAKSRAVLLRSFSVSTTQSSRSRSDFTTTATNVPKQVRPLHSVRTVSDPPPATIAALKRILSSSSSSTATAQEQDTSEDPDGPTGELFQPNKEIGPSLIGQTASIRRIFDPRSNAQAMLTCGGEALAAHASFDPDYLRAQDWIRHHAVGPAVLSPVLISGLMGALVEAAFPQAVPDSQSMKQVRPLIVGVAVNAKITVTDVVRTGKQNGSDERENGYHVHLYTSVTRVRDEQIIAEGEHCIWIPDYQKF